MSGGGIGLMPPLREYLENENVSNYFCRKQLSNCVSVLFSENRPISYSRARFCVWQVRFKSQIFCHTY